MKTYVPLKTALQEDDFTVGVKASLLSYLEKQLNLPFSLVITSDAFFEFISYNTLGEQIRNLIETPLPKSEQVKAFAQLSNDFKKASFPNNILNQLRECYELICLDANNLESLSRNNSHSKQILSLRRSTNYEDADLLCPGTVLTKNNFELFIKSIKSIYLSAFSPSSIEYRRELGIKEFSIAVVVSRLPEMTSCLEVQLEEDNNKIAVHSYVGFLDKAKIIPRDEFILEMEFLKITQRNMNKQRLAVVFDLESNRPSTKQYMTMNASNSVEEPLVLEVSRLSKKILHALQRERVHIDYVTDKHNNIYLLDIAILPKPKETQATLVENESGEEKNNFLSEEVLSLAHSLRVILQNNVCDSCYEEVQTCLKELQDSNKDSLEKAFLLCMRLLE